MPPLCLAAMKSESFSWLCIAPHVHVCIQRSDTACRRTWTMGGISPQRCIHCLLVLRTEKKSMGKRQEPCVWEETKGSDALVTVFLGHKVFKQTNQSTIWEKNQIIVYTVAASFCLSGNTCILRGKDLFFTHSNLMFQVSL